MTTTTYPPGSTTRRGYGGNHQKLRRRYAQQVAAGTAYCWRCGGHVPPGSQWHLGHDDNDRSRYRGIECVPCNTATAGRKPAGRSAFSAVQDRLDDRSRQKTSPLVDLDEYGVRPELLWNPGVLARFPWLSEFSEVPGDASPPLAMSPPPPDAVGSYGAGAIEWVESTQKIRLRWWQRLAIVRQLEHREDGSLVHRSVVESTPRRAGKSVRIRVMALWRLAHPALFGETQTVIHTGSDLQIVREIIRGAWRWAEEAAGWTVVRANGKECIESTSEDRWLARSRHAVYGYDLCLGLVDEAWDVPPETVSDGLEPAMLERRSPQLHLTSTAHRRATSLMRSVLSHALSTGDDETLLLLWGARPGDDMSDPEVWRAASPFWSEDRRKMIAAKFEQAVSGQQDPESDDPDPLAGFASQYLNIWRLRESREVGDPVVSETDWSEMAQDAPERVPDAVAVEDWFSEGVAVALAWRSGARSVVSVAEYADLDAAVDAVAGLGFAGQMRVGASIAGDPVWEGMRLRVKPVKGTVRAAVQDLGRMLAAGTLGHDGGEVLSGQVLALRTSPGVDGPRVRSTAPANAVKAATWAAQAARERETVPKPMAV